MNVSKINFNKKLLGLQDVIINNNIEEKTDVINIYIQFPLLWQQNKIYLKPTEQSNFFKPIKFQNQA